jgi:hypothetical protein
LGKLIQRRDQ